MNARRKALLALASLVALPAIGQQRPRPRRIAYISGGNALLIDAFRGGMAALGRVERRDYVMEPHERRDDNAALVASAPDLILLSTDSIARELVQKTRTIPIVFAIAQDPVGTGLAASLQKPGGNATGLTTLSHELGAKRLELLKEAFPHIVHVAMLFDPADAASPFQVKDITRAAERLRLQMTPIELRHVGGFEPAFRRGGDVGAQAYMVAEGFLLTSRYKEILSGASRARAPAFFSHATYADAGGVISYGASFADNFRRAAGYVDRIFKGMNAGDLPIEQPTKFELVVNMRTAKAMRLTIPQSVLVRADRVIE
jgi:putative ABC transport system substrate-binding protein